MYTYTLDRFTSTEGVNKYRAKFENQWTERVKNRNEQRLLRNLLRTLSDPNPNAVALDLPCGCGRFFPSLSEVVPKVVEADRSPKMLEAARAELGKDEAAKPPLGCVCASALTMPFADAAFEVVLSVRLSHHLPNQEERRQYVNEVLRITDRWAILTYLDEHSFKNRVHAWKVRRTGKRRKWTMNQPEVEQVAEESGFKVTRSEPLSRFFSAQRYALLERG